MAYRSYHSRSTRKLANKSKNSLIATIIISVALLFVTITWILPSIINGVGFINHIVKPGTKQNSVADDVTLAPPVLNVPLESTNQSPIDINGYATPKVKVEIFLDDKLVSTISSKDDGSFIASSIDLNLGTNNIYGKTADENGQESLASKTIKLIYDNEKPDLDLSEPNDNQEVQGSGTVKVVGTTETNAKVTINNVQIIIKSDGSFSTDFPINDGDNNLNIKSTDSAGNVNEINRKVTKQP